MTTFKKSTVNHFSEENVNSIIANITYMIDLVTYYNDSAEAEWAYIDFRKVFRKALYNILEKTSVNTTFTAEDKQKIGEAICKAIKSNYKDVKRNMRENR